MKKLTASIATILSLLPIGQTLAIGKGAALISTTLILSAPESVNAESDRFFYNLGIRKRKSGDYYGAISDYNKAIEINPSHPKAYNERGYSKNKLKDFEGAILDFSKAIEINQRDSFAYYNRGRSKYFLNDFYGSISDINNSIKYSSNIFVSLKKSLS